MQFANELLPRGRLTRAGFWLRHFTLIPALLALIIMIGDSFGRPYDLVPAVLLLAVLISTWGRRLHDRDRSAWWLAAAAVPVMGAVLLTIECGFRGSVERTDRFAPHATARDYLTV